MQRVDFTDDTFTIVAQEEVERYEKLLDELMEDRLSGILSRERWEKATTDAQNRLSRARTALGGSPTTPVAPKALRKAYRDSRHWEELSTDDKREVIRVLYPEIVLGRSRRTRWRGPDSKRVDLCLHTRKMT